MQDERNDKAIALIGAINVACRSLPFNTSLFQHWLQKEFKNEIIDEIMIMANDQNISPKDMQKRILSLFIQRINDHLEKTEEQSSELREKNLDPKQVILHLAQKLVNATDFTIDQFQKADFDRDIKNISDSAIKITQLLDKIPNNVNAEPISQFKKTIEQCQSCLKVFQDKIKNKQPITLDDVNKLSRNLNQLEELIQHQDVKPFYHIFLFFKNFYLDTVLYSKIFLNQIRFYFIF
ncbi:MAG: hypothetical protein LBJ93_02465 [Clostridiales bacterium]|jgi:hypothetical protein|nr:hypothetical protein [Clostridiales bacterium]